jgi:hypothetical protein
MQNKWSYLFDMEGHGKSVEQLDYLHKNNKFLK